MIFLQGVAKLHGSHFWGCRTKSSFPHRDVHLLHRLLHRLPFLLRQHLCGPHHHHLPRAGRGGVARRGNWQKPEILHRLLNSGATGNSHRSTSSIFPGYSLKFNIFVSPFYKKSLQKGGALGALHAQREGQLQVQAVEGGRLLPLWVLHHDPHRPQHNTSHDEGQLLLLLLNIQYFYQLVFLQWTREVVRKNMGIIWGFFSNGRSNNLFLAALLNTNKPSE